MNTNININTNKNVNNRYHFVTHWFVEASCEEVYRILEDVESLSRWWHSVYLDVKVLEKGQPGGVGKLVALYTKGFLPYTLKWQFRVTEANFPNGFALQAIGDFAGTGVWTFTQKDEKHCEAVYDWQIDAEKPLLKKLTWLLRPIFSANHHWAMRKGEESLKLEIRRQHATTPTELSQIPAPPKPTFPHNLLNNKTL